MDKKFAIFDMDGTLVDSMDYWCRLAGEYLASKGISYIPPHIMEQIGPMTMSESAALFVEEFSLPGTAESVAAEMNTMMEGHYRNDVPLKSGVAAYLASLQAQGVVMCVASVSDEPLMEACLRRIGVRQYFSFLLSCEEVGAGKDKPDVYWAAAQRLGGHPSEIAVYEDAPYALKTAKQAGFYTVGVYDEGYAAQWEQMTALADEVIEDF